MCLAHAADHTPVGYQRQALSMPKWTAVRPKRDGRIARPARKTVVDKWFPSSKYSPPEVCVAASRPCPRRQFAIARVGGSAEGWIRRRGQARRAARRPADDLPFLTLGGYVLHTPPGYCLSEASPPYEAISRTKGDVVTKSRLNAFIATLLAAASIATAAPSVAAPSDARSAQDVVDSLQKNGYKVIVNKIGTVPLDQCDVAAVRPGQAITAIDATGGVREVILSYTTAYVVARC